MCRQFLFIDKSDEQDQFNRENIYDTMIQAESRLGGHAYGWLYKNKGESDFHVYKRKGKVRITDYFRLPKNPEFFIFHTRLATHGAVGDMINNHPHHTDLLAITHNGVLTNKLHENCKSKCDSETILRLIEEYAPTTELESIDAMVETARQLNGRWRYFMYNKLTPNHVYAISDWLEPMWFADEEKFTLITSQEDFIEDNWDDVIAEECEPGQVYVYDGIELCIHEPLVDIPSNKIKYTPSMYSNNNYYGTTKIDYGKSKTNTAARSYSLFDEDDDDYDDEINDDKRLDLLTEEQVNRLIEQNKDLISGFEDDDDDEDEDDDGYVTTVAHFNKANNAIIGGKKC